MVCTYFRAHAPAFKLSSPVTLYHSIDVLEHHDKWLGAIGRLFGYEVMQRARTCLLRKPSLFTGANVYGSLECGTKLYRMTLSCQVSNYINCYIVYMHLHQLVPFLFQDLTLLDGQERMANSQLYGTLQRTRQRQKSA